MFIRFFSGTVNETSRVREGMFHAAFALWENGWLPRYEFEALSELHKWFDTNLESPSDHLPLSCNYDSAVCWFKPTAHEHLARAWEMATLLERNDVLIWTIKTRRTGRVYYEDDAQVFAEAAGDLRRILKR